MSTPDDRQARDRRETVVDGSARHGSAVPRGQNPLPASRGGRFGRMFPFLPQCHPDDEAIDALVRRIATVQSNENGSIPAGYTYLGQFIDHDITFDPTSELQRDNDPHALVNFRTPRFDLDSLYGAGPADQPHLYDWSPGTSQPGVRLLVDVNPGGSGLARVDLPRNRQGRALVGDARNDENLIVSQLHLLFIRFHNRVIEHLLDADAPLQGHELLDEAQRIVRWHYQWIVTHDFLTRIVGDKMARSVLEPAAGDAPPTVHRRFYRWHDQPAIPVEFSAAAYRFGHSMVRPKYRLNHDTLADLFPTNGGHAPNLSGFRRLPATHTIDWDLFFRPETPNGGQNISMQIDAGLVPPLFHLPHAAAPDGPELARLNLRRGRALGLPAGRDVARAMSVAQLTDDDLLPAGATLAPVSESARKALLHATPLWYYILCEAGKPGAKWGNSGQHLGPVGGRIVAEVLVGLLEADPSAYLRQWPSWTPELRRADDADFTMLDLVRFVEDDSEPRSP